MRIVSSNRLDNRPSPRRGGLTAFLVAALWLLSSNAFAQFISDNDLFLAPTAVPEVVYDPVELDLGNSRVFSAADVSGATSLTALRILPLLNANPLTSQGEYTDSDLASITASNQSTYFYAKPNIHYSATDIIGNASMATFNLEGQYYVELTTNDGISDTSTVFRVDVEDHLLEIPSLGLRDKTGPGRVIVCPKTDCTLISNPNRADKALAEAKKAVPDGVLVNDLAAAKAALADKFKKNGNKKFSLTIIAHGAPGQVEVGSDILGFNGKMTAAQFQKMIDPFVSSISFFSCSVGAGAAGTKFGKDLGASIQGGVTVFDKPVTINAKIWDVDAKGTARKFDFVAAPEPATLALFVFPLLGLIGRMKRD